MRKDTHVVIFASVMLTVIAVAACHKDAPQAPADPNEGRVHPGALVGVWNAEDAPLDANRSTCSKCEPVAKGGGTLRFATNESGPPNLYGYSFMGQALQRGEEGLLGTADCTAPGARERVLLAPGPTGVDGWLTRERGKDCNAPFQAQCACVYTIQMRKVSDFADGPQPVAAPAAPVPQKT